MHDGLININKRTSVILRLHNVERKKERYKPILIFDEEDKQYQIWEHVQKRILSDIV